MGLSNILNKKIINISGNVIGLEINDLSVRTIQLERVGKKNDIVSYGQEDVQPDSISDGEILAGEKVIAAVKGAISKARPKPMKAKKVICSISETKAFLRIINIPKMKPEEVKEAIKWEIEANIPLSIDQVYYDWQILDRNFSSEKGKMSILIMAVSRKIVDQMLEILEEADLEAIDIEIESIAQARSLLDQEEKNKTVLIVDLGGRRTSFLVSVDNIPCFTSSVPLSARLLTDAISKDLNMNFKEAEKTKKEYGIGSAVKNDPIFKAVKPILESLIVEMERSIDFYVTGLKYSDAIDRIILCGGGANTVGLIPYLTKRLNREIELGNPWVNFDMENRLPIIEKKDSVQYSTVIGLALKNLYYENIS